MFQFAGLSPLTFATFLARTRRFSLIYLGLDFCMQLSVAIHSFCTKGFDAHQSGTVSHPRKMKQMLLTQRRLILPFIGQLGLQSRRGLFYRQSHLAPRVSRRAQLRGYRQVLVRGVVDAGLSMWFPEPQCRARPQSPQDLEDKICGVWGALSCAVPGHRWSCSSSGIRRTDSDRVVGCRAASCLVM